MPLVQKTNILSNLLKFLETLVFYLSLLLNRHHGIVVITPTQLFPTKSEFWFCADLSPACGVSKIFHDEIFDNSPSSTWKVHYVKSAQIRSFFWSVFSRIRTEYGEILRISKYLSSVNLGVKLFVQKKQSQRKNRFILVSTDRQKRII